MSEEQIKNLGQKNNQSKNKIFIIHGRNQDIKNEVISLIKKFNLEAVLTLDEVNVRKPLAEKVTEYSKVSLAIVILCDDDFVYPKDGKPAQALMMAGQRVVFEFGFWLGKLGRERVIALYYDQKSFRCPTKYFDALYIPYNKEGLWKQELFDRLKQTGLSPKV